MKFTEEIQKEIDDMIYRFEDFLKIVKGDFVCEVDGKRIAKGDIDTEPYRNYVVATIKAESGVLLIELKPFESATPKCNPDEDWVKDHKVQFGTEPSFI